MFYYEGLKIIVLNSLIASYVFPKCFHDGQMHGLVGIVKEHRLPEIFYLNPKWHVIGDGEIGKIVE